ncbi:MAG: hypothetical protein IJR94_08675 [Synergistaceae bacterium]|nr:hypothetical protein [Synergistaceae bacterium]
MGLDVDVAFLGDSITRGGEYQSQFPDVKIINLGYGGDTLRGMTERVGMVKAVHPEKIFVMGGINGFASLGVAGSLLDYKNLLATLRENFPTEEIYVQSILPVSREKLGGENIPQANAGIKNLCGEFNATYIDLFSLYADKDGRLNKDLTTDGVHLKPAAYSKWYEAIKPYVYSK